jgi:dolichol-phosphate mannosyltransferase
MSTLERPAFDLVIVMPVYNEEACIQSVVAEWLDVLDDAAPQRGRLMIVNDGSTDATGTILSAICDSRTDVIVCSTENRGHGPAVCEGYRQAVAQGAEWVFQTDSDGQIPAREFDALWRVRHQSEFVFGHRQHRDDAWPRLLVSYVSRMLVRACGGGAIVDPNVPFRLMRGALLDRLMTELPPGIFAPNILLGLLACRHGAHPCNVVIEHRRRRSGVSSLAFARLLRVCLRCTGELVAFARAHRRGRKGNQR